ncbi:MAG: glutamate racemase [Lachnospiraceae bacterium]|jgi:glutamate racemase|nr:glutamate racemase [Lachnospiraceae bacterium]
MTNLQENEKPIAVFDSGLGGLTVFREILRQLPDENLIYFGDTARVPYGSKSRETIIHYTEQILNFLRTKEVKAIVVACNTVSAYALEELKDRVEVPIIGVVKPGAYAAVKQTKTRRIGVMGTEGTVRSGLYPTYIHEIDPSVLVFQKPCPLIVPLVEEGLWEDPLTTEAVRRYTRVFREEHIDTVIMGCTHYPLVRDTIRKVLGDDVTLVNPAYETTAALRRVLEEKGLLRTMDAPVTGPPYRFYVSDDPEKFKEFASRVLRFEIPEPRKIDIEAY